MLTQPYQILKCFDIFVVKKIFFLIEPLPHFMINHSFALFITLLWIKFSKDPCHVVIIFWMALNMMVEPAPNRITSVQSCNEDSAKIMEETVFVNYTRPGSRPTQN